ncbi:MAG: Spx/MgsR family RNA polymerase-binding regulatory protein [Bacteroidota bacterium]|nr:Spx/MgsR family RNA polymerase-binding regulatory protein [Bacteroidota bacterium]
MSYQVYGIPNCNTVKKALAWLSQHAIPFEFHNLKKEGITSTLLMEWCQQVGWAVLVNKQGTTWKKLDASVQASIISESKAISLMQKSVSIIKRPVITQHNNILAVGFNETLYKKIFVPSK